MTLLRPDRKKRRLYHLQSLLDDWGIQYFRAEELCRLTSRDWPEAWRGLYPPPTGMAGRIRHTIEMADEIRKRWGSPVLCISGFRPTTYNDALRSDKSDHQGSEDSQHLYFRALDIKPVDGGMSDFYDVVEAVAVETFKDGIHTGRGYYRTFCHVDAGRYSADYRRTWDSR